MTANRQSENSEARFLYTYRSESGHWAGKVLEEVGRVNGPTPSDVLSVARTQFHAIPLNGLPYTAADYSPVICPNCDWCGQMVDTDAHPFDDDADGNGACPECSTAVEAAPVTWRFAAEICHAHPFGWTGIITLNGRECGRVDAATQKRVKQLIAIGWPTAMPGTDMEKTA